MIESFIANSANANYLNTGAPEFEAFHPAFPMMLVDDEHACEWDNLTMIAEQTDDPRDWEAADDMESACDHMVFEGRW